MQTPLGKLTSLDPRLPGWILAVLLLRRGEGIGRKEKRMRSEEKKGENMERKIKGSPRSSHF